MNTILAGFISQGASCGLGLPDEYGLMCVIGGILLVGMGAYLLPEKPKAEVVRVPLQSPD